MGRQRKPFIDKKQATTYNLIYRASEVAIDGEEAEEPQRQLVDARLGIGIGRPDEDSVSAAQAGPSDAHPMSWLQVRCQLLYSPPQVTDSPFTPAGNVLYYRLRCVWRPPAREGNVAVYCCNLGPLRCYHPTADPQQNCNCTGNLCVAELQEAPLDNLSEQRRQELIEMGFPDDGYDYLKHMRAGSRAAAGTAELVGSAAPAEPSAAGPAVFVPAALRQPLEDDEKMFDARQLVIHEPATDDVSNLRWRKLCFRMTHVNTCAAYSMSAWVRA